MVVTVLLVCMVMLTDHLIYGLPMDGKISYSRALPGGNCSSLCPAGYYLSNCRCFPCSSGFFTSQKNREDSCHRCYQSCKPDFNKEVVKECTNTSDVQCRCLDGFFCTEKDIYTGHCRTCEPITASTPDQSYTSTDFPSVTISNTRQHDPQSWLSDEVLVWILFGFMSIMLSVIFLTIFLRLCRKKEKECFKQFVRRYSLGNLEMESETTPPPNQPIEQPHAQEVLSHASTPTNHNTDGSFHQPTSSEQAVPPPGNLGPLHIYGPHTVFVSLLNQFRWDGGEKKTHELQEESINHPQSPPVHLSEEERSRENDFFIFPSQEQGKECHISKEEVLLNC
ncbi:tumor necrosis factor receptor superfamily member 5-like [Myxocyprinus asiaticus]|uniref:tumor necrosis factor receptor superfamily member 5-like n=1 Tax=Myxocyprinus asiaticus TaxID=70543 RepID=UPI00222366EB|nr:tumor necrosis factor receptor superfamily member 5-like [Myxocyprinus asiaticus]